ncbi:2-oxo-4-hydroxy-4-carboxy-5-ureidoimidazoline decarboxylase [Enterobacter sp. CC120223-11]|uniref:2-oxo-4-hydroxy-4-carboxy-5-ureidoimidazoline decarboxylase n=1 Tax=Enterobacter sp. CC120223-11 TaxID=1378073 RepID=UPI0020D1D37F|nr:2-oxo-4-hydroxy-4-carboxy-5-ureidoimidazoline decarboxylase [Enterobacter sp. CC120223-11]
MLESAQPGPLQQFNAASHEDALAMIAACVALPEWQRLLVAERPFMSVEALMQKAAALSERWQENELAQALQAHPRIGDKPKDASAESALSRQEQSAVNGQDRALTQALAQGNADYEARFGRVFLIRAKGRSGEEILSLLQARLQNDDAAEVQAALEQLRQITLLRLEGVFIR